MNHELTTALQQLDPVADVPPHELQHDSASAQRIYDRALGQPAPTRRSARSRRRWTPLLVGAVVLIGGLGAWASPWPGDLPVDCRNAGSIDQLVATRQLDDGTRYELWTTQAGLDAPVNGHLVITKRPDGSTLGSSLGCSPPGSVEEITDPLAAVSYGGARVNLDTRTGTTQSFGPAPAGAATVEVTFSDGAVLKADVTPQHYWLLVRELDHVEFDEDRDEPVLPQPVKLTALDAHGNLVDQHRIS